MAHQIGALGKQRLKSKPGDLGQENLLAVERAIRVQLAGGGGYSAG